MNRNSTMRCSQQSIKKWRSSYLIVTSKFYLNLGLLVMQIALKRKEKAEGVIMVQKHRLSAEQPCVYSSYSKTKLFIDELQTSKFSIHLLVALYSQIL